MYPQLTLNVSAGMSKSDIYKDIVLRGIFPDNLTFPLKSNNEEERIVIDTPIGKVECLYLPQREIFERFVEVLAYQCEPTIIPKSTGAMLISGINCYRKILLHQEEFLKTHKQEEWDEEFDLFVSNPDNYKSTVLLISKGYYSALDYKETCYEKEEYLRISKDIRIYHEISHYICRKLFIEHLEPVRDEVIADTIGIIYATKKFDPLLLKKFLGIENDVYRKGGRLENYCGKEEIEDKMHYCKELINKLEIFIDDNKSLDPFALLLKIEREYIR